MVKDTKELFFFSFFLSYKANCAVSNSKLNVLPHFHTLSIKVEVWDDTMGRACFEVSFSLREI